MVDDTIEDMAAWVEMRKAQRKTQFDPDAWRKNLLRSATGSPLPVLQNALIAMRESDNISGIFSYDEMLNTVMVSALQGVGGFDQRPICDTDVGVVQAVIQKTVIPRLGRDVSEQAIDIIAKDRSFHPVRDYLTRLEWDGNQRLDKWLVDYLGVETWDHYTKQVGQMFMISCVARIFEPGCKVDHMVVLEGRQGSKKSSACAILGGEWFSDSLPDITTGKDVSQHLRGKWIIEIPELSATRKAENEALKAFISRQVERYRPSYGRYEVIQPRQCVFMGTTNNSSYLRDETGGRRFWPVKTGHVDMVALARDRDQLFAEAVVLYRDRQIWWPDKEFEEQFIQPQQEMRFESDPWEELVTTYIDTLFKVTIIDIAKNALYIDTAKVGTSDQRRISAILQRLGWVRGALNGKGRLEWLRPTT
jgi:predicted P-loop ATPase